jgi:hypothetical protein
MRHPNFRGNECCAGQFRDGAIFCHHPCMQILSGNRLWQPNEAESCRYARVPSRPQGAPVKERIQHRLSELNLPVVTLGWLMSRTCCEFHLLAYQITGKTKKATDNYTERLVQRAGYVFKKVSTLVTQQRATATLANIKARWYWRERHSVRRCYGHRSLWR